MSRDKPHWSHKLFFPVVLVVASCGVPLLPPPILPPSGEAAVEAQDLKDRAAAIQKLIAAAKAESSSPNGPLREATDEVDLAIWLLSANGDHSDVRNKLGKAEKLLLSVLASSARRLSVGTCASDKELQLAYRNRCAQLTAEATATGSADHQPQPSAQPSRPPKVDEVQAFKDAIEKCKADVPACKAECRAAPTDACVILAEAHWEGDTNFVQKQNRGEGFRLIHVTCEAGLQHACRFEEAFHRDAAGCGSIDECKPFCDAKVGEGCDKIADAYARGDEVPVNRGTAQAYTVKACEYGIGSACREAGVAYIKGWGTTRNMRKAQEALSRSCELKDDIGCALYERFCLETRTCH